MRAVQEDANPLKMLNFLVEFLLTCQKEKDDNPQQETILEFHISTQEKRKKERKSLFRNVTRNMLA